MEFRIWLEEVEKDRRYWEDFFLAVFRLDRKTGGLGKNIAGFNTKDLMSNSEFANLDPKLQQMIVNKIQSGNGTVSDLAGIAGGDQSVDRPNPSFSLPFH